MERYEHGGNVYAHPGCVDFSANLNPLGMPAATREALRAGVGLFEAYPDPVCAELVESIAAFERVPADWVIPCAGATDAFARICQLLRPRKALVCAPCYSGYEQALEQVGADVAYYDLNPDDDFAVTSDLVRDLVPSVDLLFIANPNNPTGRCVGSDVLVACLERAREIGAMVVLDECFIDLVSPVGLGQHTDSEQRAGSNALLSQHPNLVLVKALTKSYCLAGLRVGYALCANPQLVERLQAAGQPWAVSTPAQLAGIACLADKDFLPKTRSLITCERERLADALRDHGMRVIPGEANYLLFYGPCGLADALLAHNILIRTCDNYRGLSARWYRIAVRTPQQNDQFIAALREVTQ